MKLPLSRFAPSPSLASREGGIRATGDTLAAGLRRRQRGVAAVEFALIAGVMVMLLMGMFVYWRVLQAQQSLARATGDGARMVQHLAFGGMAGYNPAKPAERANILQATSDVVNQSLAASGIPAGTAPTQIQINWGTSQATLSVVYMLPPVLGQGLQVGSQTLGEPTRLESRSLIRLAPGS
ncbi:TadE/TadG family type IV pilus assembly protein [Delftia acidovorans]|uniref:TadE/TadG family type IV pilus assembly protein n=1 Tax=Delftia acidovorans TaxID=80866 RepID=UPI00359F5132